MSKSKVLPKLPYGQGSFSYRPNGKIQYKKRIKINDKIISKSVVGDSAKDCMTQMAILERRLANDVKNKHNELLADAMLDWLNNVKKKELKDQSFSRLESTIKNQIENSSIGHLRYQNVKTEDIDDVITDLIDKRYSHSTIKKTYDALNAFYRYKAALDGFSNPMLLVTMPTSNNVKVETRQVEFFEQDDIDRFVNECGAKYNTGAYKYKCGYALAANIYLGMRIGELLALQWKDIDFQNNTIYVCKTLIERKNDKYDYSNPELMSELGIKKIEFVVQNSTKKSKNRYVPINSKAREFLLLHRNMSEFTGADNYVISTRNGKTSTVKNISDTIQAIEKEAETKVQHCGTHILRHTCASLYFRKGVPIETICQILGNTREVCEKTYVHFIEEQLKEAASKIDVIEI